jgi:predicted CXXCH cytochrome family protein
MKMSTRLLLVVLFTGLALACSPSPNATRVAGQFVDESGCAGCHAAQHKAWAGSHHDLAMQEITEQTVLGDFNNSRFSYAGVTSRFFRREGKFVVNTDGPDGKLADFEIRHTFGVKPLQQYLIELPGGRLQALSIAWDTQRQRWFHLYPNERVDHRDELHWTKPSQNWNHMCGECHATDYRKNYDAATNSFKTTATRFDVGCQACHGPASRHAEWAKRAGDDVAKAARGSRKQDFSVDLAARDSRLQIDTCARCHSRRGTLSADYRHGAPLMDTHLPALLSERLYHADGQIQDEVYEYGSFLQSKMHAKGLRCSDCHEPHSTKLRASGNALCVTCHNASTPAAGSHIDSSGLQRKDYDAPAHHFHKPGQPGSQCVDCHAPARTYMVVDPRRDHSFRIPRPDLSVAIGTPNACNQCHNKQSPKWAADAVAKWYGPNRRQEPHYGVALDAGRHAKPGAVSGLIRLAGDATQPAIVRASALDLLSRYPGRSALTALQNGLRDPDPLVRRAAVVGQERLAPVERVAALSPMLNDPVRAVRIEAARLLAPAVASLDEKSRTGFDQALAEFEAAQTENADRPEALANLGNLYSSRGETTRAEAAYRKAIALDPGFVPAYANLADLYRAGGRDADAERTLRDGLRMVPNAATLHEALGLALVRQKKKQAALAEFAAAVKAAPDDPRHTYIYAVALHDAGRRAEAVRLLESAAQRAGDRDVLLTLASFRQAAGDLAGTEKALRKLAAINPDDPALAGWAGGR